MRDGMPRVGESESIPVSRKQVSGMGLFQRLTAACSKRFLIASPEGPGTCRVVPYLILMLTP